MTNKYRSGYAEGGFLDDGASVDPVSGNEVPVGSLAEEVRDDVPAQLSEGEFVVPADVVRFIGLDKLMKMRNAAKAGLADMEAEGQVGGQPAPAMEDPMMDDDMEMDALIDGMDGGDFESAVQRFAEGGSVAEMPTYETYTGRKFNENVTVEYTDYTNDAGNIIKVRTVKGKPLEEVPEGYYQVGSVEEDKTTGGSGSGESAVQTRSTVNSGPSMGAARNKEYQNSIQRTNEENKSLRITQERSSVLNAMHKDNMSQQEVDELFASLTPMAQAEYDTRFRDPKYVDKYMVGNKSPVELMIIAQKTVDSRNRMNGNLELNSAILPTGDPIDIEGTLEGLYEAFVATKAGILALKDLGKDGVLRKLIGGEGERKGNNTQPTVTSKPVKYDQAHWRSRMSELSKANVSPADIQKQLLKEQRAVVANSGGTVNAYGNKVMREPGQPAPRTVWDDIAEVQASQKNTIDVNTPTPMAQDVVDRDDKLLKEMALAELPTSSITLPNLFAQDAVDRDDKLLKEMNGVPDSSPEVTGTPDDNTTGFVNTPTPLAQDVVDRDKKLLEEMNGVPDSSPFSQDVVDRDKKLLEEMNGVSYQDQYDAALEEQLNYNENFFDEQSQLKLNEGVGTPTTTGATLGTTGELGTLTPTQEMVRRQLEFQQYAIDNGLDPATVTAALEKSGTQLGLNDLLNSLMGTNDPAENTISKRQQDELDRQAKRAKDEQERQAKRAQDEQDRIRDRDRRAVVRNEKKLSDELAVTNPVAAATLTDQQRRQQSQTTVNSGGDPSNKKGDNSGYGGGGGSGAAGKGAGTAKSGYSFGLSQGGLATKNKPKIKKMRNDPTAGLASKKKAKQKAQAKKGALAAKRT